ncbi:hypothetical protein Vretifemale_2160, partial [Volvox reticuliferus]
EALVRQGVLSGPGDLASSLSGPRTPSGQQLTAAEAEAVAMTAGKHEVAAEWRAVAAAAAAAPTTTTHGSGAYGAPSAPQGRAIGHPTASPAASPSAGLQGAPRQDVSPMAVLGEPWVGFTGLSSAIEVASFAADGGGVSHHLMSAAMASSSNGGTAAAIDRTIAGNSPGGSAGDIAATTVNVVQGLTHGSSAESSSIFHWSSRPNALRAVAGDGGGGGGGSGGRGGGSSAQQPAVLDSASAGRAIGSSSGVDGVRSVHRDIGLLLPPSMLSGYEVFTVKDLYPHGLPAVAAVQTAAAQHLAIAPAACGGVRETSAQVAARTNVDNNEDVAAGAIHLQLSRRSLDGPFFSAGGGGDGGVARAATTASLQSVLAAVTTANGSGSGGGDGGGGGCTLLVTSHSRGIPSAVMPPTKSGLISRISAGGFRGVAAAAAALISGPNRASQLRSPVAAANGHVGSTPDVCLLDSPMQRSRAVPSLAPYGSNSLMLYLHERNSPAGVNGGGAGAARSSGIYAAAQAVGGGGSGSIPFPGLPLPPPHLSSVGGVASGSTGRGVRRRRRSSAAAFSSMLVDDDFMQLLAVAGNNDGRPEGVIEVQRQDSCGGAVLREAAAAAEGPADGCDVHTATVGSATLTLMQRHPSVHSLLIADRGSGSHGATSSGGTNSNVLNSASVVLHVNARTSRAGGVPRGAAAVAASLSAASRSAIQPITMAMGSSSGGGGGSAAADGGGGGGGGGRSATGGAARLTRMGSRTTGGFASSSGFISSGPLRDTIDPALGRQSRGDVASGSWRRTGLIRQPTPQHVSLSGTLPQTANPPTQSRNAVLFDSLVRPSFQHRHPPRTPGEASSSHPSARGETSSGDTVADTATAAAAGGSGSGSGGGGGWFGAVPRRADEGPVASQRTRRRGGGGGGDGAGGPHDAAEDSRPGQREQKKKLEAPAAASAVPTVSLLAAVEVDDEPDLLATSSLLLGGSGSLAVSLSAAVATLNATRQQEGGTGSICLMGRRTADLATGAEAAVVEAEAPKPSLPAMGATGDSEISVQPSAGEGGPTAAAAPVLSYGIGVASVTPPPPLPPTDVGASTSSGMGQWITPPQLLPSPLLHPTRASSASNNLDPDWAAASRAPLTLPSAAPGGQLRRSVSKQAFVRGWNMIKSALGLKFSRTSGGGGDGQPSMGRSVGRDNVRAGGTSGPDADSRESRGTPVYDTSSSPRRMVSISRFSRQSSCVSGTASLAGATPQHHSTASAAMAVAALQTYDVPTATALGRSRSYCLPPSAPRGGGGGGIGSGGAGAGGAVNSGGNIIGGEWYGNGLVPAEAVRCGSGSFTSEARWGRLSPQLQTGVSRVSSRDARSPMVGPGGGPTVTSSSMRRKSALGFGALSRLNSTGTAAGGGGGGSTISSIVRTGSISRGDGADASVPEYDYLRTVPGSPKLMAHEHDATVSLPANIAAAAAAATATTAAAAAAEPICGSGGSFRADVTANGASGNHVSCGSFESASVGRRAPRRLPLRQASSVSLAVDAAAAVLAAGIASPAGTALRVPNSSSSPTKHTNSCGIGVGLGPPTLLPSPSARSAAAAAAAATAAQNPHPQQLSQNMQRPLSAYEFRSGGNDDTSPAPSASASTWAVLMATPNLSSASSSAAASGMASMPPSAMLPVAATAVLTPPPPGRFASVGNSQCTRVLRTVLLSAQSQPTPPHLQQDDPLNPGSLCGMTFARQDVSLQSGGAVGGRNGSEGSYVTGSGGGSADLPSDPDGTFLNIEGVETAAAAAVASQSNRVRAMPRRQQSLLRLLLNPIGSLGGNAGGSSSAGNSMGSRNRYSGGGNKDSPGITTSMTGMAAAAAAGGVAADGRPRRRPLKRVVSELPSSLRNAGAAAPSDATGGGGGGGGGGIAVHRRLNPGGSSTGVRPSGTGFALPVPQPASSASGYCLQESYSGASTSTFSPPHGTAGRGPRRAPLRRRDSIIGNLLAEMAGEGVGPGMLPSAEPSSGGQLTHNSKILSAAATIAFDPHAPEGVISWERPRAWDES